MRISTILFLILFQVLFLASVYPVAAAKPIFVGANLNAYKPPHWQECNIEVPSQYSTIQAAINASVASDTICVDAGNYSENLIITKQIRLSGDGYKKTVLSGLPIPGENTIITGVVSGVIIEGFTVIGMGDDRGTSAVRLWEQTSNTIVRYNYIKSGKGALALLTDNGQTNNLVQHNILEGNESADIAKVNAFDSNKPTNIVNFLNNTFLGTVAINSIDSEVFALDAGAPNSKIYQNVFNATGSSMLALVSSNNTSVVTENNFNSSVLKKVMGNGVAAENNWWGDLDPSDNVLRDVDYEPFASLPFKEY